MKINFTPAVRLSLGLVFLTISLLFVAHGLGLIPDQEEGLIASRKQLAENLAMQTSMGLRRNNNSSIRSFYDQSVKYNASLRSIALRKSDGSFISVTDNHEQFWEGHPIEGSSPTHIKIPIKVNGIKKAELEVSFHSLSHEAGYWLGLPHFVWLIFFVCTSGFLAFMVYMKRVLHHLDPSSVVPTRVRNALNVMGEGVLITDKRSQIVLVNEALVSKLKLPESALVGHRIGDFDWVADDGTVGKPMPWALAQEQNERQIGVRLSLRVGQEVLVFRVNAVPVEDGKGKSIGVIASFNDISELEVKTQLIGALERDLEQNNKDLDKKNRELKYLAMRDPLTNCYNRRTLFSQLNKSFEKYSSVGTEFSLILLDVDHFKGVNNKHGQVIGDEIILGLAETLVFNIRPGDIVARVGGQEFCILLPDTFPDKAYVLAEVCRKKIEAKTISGLKVTASFGVSSVQHGAVKSNELIQQAEEAVVESKRNGRNRTTLWHRDIHETIPSPAVHEAPAT